MPGRVGSSPSLAPSHHPPPPPPLAFPLVRPSRFRFRFRSPRIVRSVPAPHACAFRIGAQAASADPGHSARSGSEWGSVPCPWRVPALPPGASSLLVRTFAFASGWSSDICESAAAAALLRSYDGRELVVVVGAGVEVYIRDSSRTQSSARSLLTSRTPGIALDCRPSSQLWPPLPVLDPPSPVRKPASAPEEPSPSPSPNPSCRH